MSSALFCSRPEGGGEILLPQQLAVGGWGRDQLRGIAVSSALARAAEVAVASTGRTGLQPVRWTVDLFRPATMAPCRTRTAVVRAGRRLCLVDASLEQGDEVVARGTALYLRAGETPEGQVWSPDRVPSPPPTGLEPVAREPRLYYSDGVGWTASATDHQNGARKASWHRPVPVVEGEEPRPFQMVAGVADVVNMVTNWGSRGLAYINADITLSLARLPDGPEVGLESLDRVAGDGIAVSTAVVHDRRGPIGTAGVSAVANAHRAVDLRKEWGFGAEPVTSR